MKAAVYYETGGPDVFRYEDIADPDVPDGNVLVRVEVISIEGGDSLHRSGGEMTETPHVVGYQCAGTVVGVTPGVKGVAVGDQVVTVGLDGSYAELRSVPEAFCWSIPAGLALAEAACIPVAYGTAHDCLFEFGRLRAGETVLIQAGASGVGIAAIQMARQAGARVLATASRHEKLERLREFGLDQGVNYSELDVSTEVRRITDGRGVDLVVESVGGSSLGRSLSCLAYRGRCVSLGDAGRGGATMADVSTMRPNNLTLVGYFLGAELFLDPRTHRMVGGLLDDVAAGRLRVVIDRQYPLSDVSAAHAYIESRQAFGRVVLIP
jgi:NADPH2:quinone reductase